MKVDQTMTSSTVDDAKALRRAFGAFATGVTVVTTGGPVPHAMTANSFTSVSLDPPLVLVCIDRGTVMHQCLSMTGFFGVSVLGARQEKEARHFANRYRPMGMAQFDPVEWLTGELTGVPLIAGTVARFECELWRSYDGGDHTIFIGKVLGMEHQADGDGLLVYRGQFQEVTSYWREVPA
ncbi:flavin reductase family protein [Streptosporangium pseudovulgare]|uniref:Flavin reductase n=1 Tax=Streptosporangium pseudovulgare TaxID=35765 RepID=A0ABQ2RBD7_9ACTN|nr:flavin reductase family protein [Streptosporangium pseudovulgare]GGQ18344.1 flavin reductase [Streptosporangium pseudovulgare]